MSVSYYSLSASNCVSSYENYKDAFDFIIENDVRNIALTGSYGSGKSSLILTFQEEHTGKDNGENLDFLNLSLATFKHEEGKDVNENEIEKSIFKQMLYGEKADQLKYSRFQGISEPESSWKKSIITTLAIIGFYLLFHHLDYFVTQAQINWFWFGCIIGTLLLWLFLVTCIMRHFYKLSRSWNLKKITFQGASVEQDKNISVFNEHLDEIIYFFQSTNYDFVVIEDLDRFNNPDIFISLRELNKLINDNAGVQKKRGGKSIKFLYALRDDMFQDKDRTKFFDFIIPVIPFVNTSNSYDKLDELLKSANIRADIDTDFLRNVSLHINDFRHLNNTINEYKIYSQNLNKGLDRTRLFGLILYKNFYPEDFESLHEKIGVFHSVLKSKEIKLKEHHANLKVEVDAINGSIEAAKASLTKNVESLVYMYQGCIASKANNPIRYIRNSSNNNLNFPNLTIDDLEAIKKNSNGIQVTYVNGASNYLGVGFKDIEDELHLGQTIQQKRKELERCNQDNIQNLRTELQHTLEKIRVSSRTSLADLYSHTELRALIDEENKTINSDLLVYLIKSGNLDEQYYSYTTFFHQGAITESDNKFLIDSQVNRIVENTYVIDNPEEVCHRLGEHFFDTLQSLNISLIDYLLSDTQKNKSLISKTVSLIQREFKSAELFLIAYYGSGEHTGTLFELLCTEWDEFSEAVSKSSQAATHIKQMVEAVKDEKVWRQQNERATLTKYFSLNSHLIFDESSTAEQLSLLSLLEVKFESLGQCSEQAKLMDYIIQKDRFVINVSNMKVILTHLKLSEQQIENCNYTSLLKSGNDELQAYIQKNIEGYLENVLLQLPENTEEDFEALVPLYYSEDISDPIKENVLAQQSHVVKDLSIIPESLWATAILEEKVFPSWIEISKFFSQGDSSKDTLDSYLNRSHIAAQLSSQKISNEKDEDTLKKSLSRYILNNFRISSDSYRLLIQSLPYHYTEFPESTPSERIQDLIKTRAVQLYKGSYTQVESDHDHLVQLIQMNESRYFKDKDNYPLTDDVRGELIGSTFTTDHQLRLCEDISSPFLIGDREVATKICKLLSENDFSEYSISNETLKNSIVSSKSVGESLDLLSITMSIWNEDDVMEMLQAFPEPYSDIAHYKKRPKLKNTKQILTFVQQMEEADFISSFKEESDGIRVITKSKK